MNTLFPPRKKRNTFTIDTKGNRWVWNCGWYIVDKHGEPLKTRQRPARKFYTFYSQHCSNKCVMTETKQRPDSRQQPMGRAEFERVVTLLDPSDKAQREILHGMDKPGQYWRRHVFRELMHHSLFGSCYMLASDGCHAIVEVLGEHKKVCFENLSEPIGVPLPKREKKAPAKKKAVKKAPAKKAPAKK